MDRPFAKLHLDAQIMPVAGIIGAALCPLLVDDYSRYCIGFANASRSEHVMNLQHVQAFAKTSVLELHRNFDLVVLQFDGAREYTSPEVKKFLLDKGVITQVTAPYTPESDGVAERTNGIISDTRFNFRT